MKKIIEIITALKQLAILSCIVCLHYSCKRDRTDCSKYQITSQEEALLSAYNKGDIVVFKNDTTIEFDTLHVIYKEYGKSYYYEPCNHFVYNSLYAQFTFSHLKDLGVNIWHNKTSEIIYLYTGYEYPLSGSLQTMTINGTIYNDVYVKSIDSTIIPASERYHISWKIAYSKSKGFVRFYMVNGQTWSKL